MTIDQPRSRIQAARACGVVRVELRERAAGDGPDDGRAAADALAVDLGFRALGDRWHALRRAEAHEVIRDVLRRDLAYDCAIMEPAAAAGLADEFLALFAADARFFTNCAFEEHLVFIVRNGYATSDPLTGATFDTGVVAVDRRSAGIIWVEDED